jgi:hypothetical protein
VGGGGGGGGGGGVGVGGGVLDGCDICVGFVGGWWWPW